MFGRRNPGGSAGSGGLGGSSAAVKTHFLPKLTGLPTEKDLTAVLLEAQNRSKVMVYQSWGVVKPYIYTIGVKVDPEPVWTMYQGSESDAVIFQHATADFALIHSLILQVVPDEMVVVSGSPRAAVSANDAYMDEAVGPVTLSGQLENMPASAVLQSVQLGKMSGRLLVNYEGTTAQIFFEDGVPIHAVSAEGTGDAAVMDLMLWEKGQFRLFPSDKTTERSVHRRLDNLIMEGTAILDYAHYLAEAGLDQEAFPVRLDKTMNAEEFRARLSQGIPMDLGLLKAFYDLVDNRSRLKEILQRRPSCRVEWVPVLFNLLSCRLIAVSEQAPMAGRAVNLAPVEIEPAVLLPVTRTLIRGETGMYTYPALLFFLQQEFKRSTVLGTPLAFLLFECCIASGGAPQPVSPPGLQEAMRRIEGLKRPIDSVGHYETFDFAMIMPSANLKMARSLALRIADALSCRPLIAGPPHRLLLACGIASAPEDTQDLGRLIAAARLAKSKAKETGAAVKLFAELEEPH